MHTLQHIAVPAESKEEAFERVKSQFESMYSETDGLGGWSDWHVVGGGRWNSDPNNQYNDNEAWNDVVSYDEDPSKFNDIIKNALLCRASEAKSMYERIDLDKFKEYAEAFIEREGEVLDTERFDMNFYYITSVSNIIRGHWNQDSFFYDLEHFSTYPAYMLESIDKGNKNWYLVPVDFHY